MFAQQNIFAEESASRRFVAEFVDKALYSAKPAIDEASSSKEESLIKLIDEDEQRKL